MYSWYFVPDIFLIKDQASKRVLHHDKVEKGLYLLKSLEKMS
jgi:hypothetical protein